MRIVWTADENYAAPMLASMRSAITHTRGELDAIAVVSCGLSDSSKDRVRKVGYDAGVRVHIAELDGSSFDGLPSGVDTGAEIKSLVTYARLFIPELLPQSWTRSLYLDPDTLVRRPLTELWRLDVKSAPIAAAQEPYCPYISSDAGVRNWRELGLDPDAPYFNAGVMLMNLTVWRETGLGAAALDYARRHFDDIFLVDQEALNSLVCGRFHLLDPVWNVTSYWRKPERQTGIHRDILPEARIRHFTGTEKPWLASGRHQPHTDEFLAYYEPADD